MSWRKFECPIYASQDGVCGCPQFWERRSSQRAQPDMTTPSSQKIQISDKARLVNDSHILGTSCENTDPRGTPRETCFFWYHGTCHRGKQCNFAHESHITWPITPPPNFVHFEPCYRPLCPLRQDLAALMEGQGRNRSRSRVQLGGQLDGAAASFLGRDAPSDDTPSNQESARSDEEVHGGNTSPDATPLQSLIDLSSRPLKGSYSDSGSSEAGKSDNIALAEQSSNDVVSSPALDAMDYFDLSNCTPLPPSSDVDEPIVLSLSHPGTLGKRGSESLSSPDREDSDCKRSKLGLKHGMSHPISLPLNIASGSRNTEPSDELRRPRKSAQGSTYLESEHYTNAMDIANSYTAPSVFSTGFLHQLPLKPELANPGHLFANMQHHIPPQSNVGIPTGPRALGGGVPVCFYWYHKGHCNPKVRNGQLIKCNFAHSLDGPCKQVSLPPCITNHDQHCPLPLCPVPRPETRARDNSNPAVENLRKAIDTQRDTPKKGRDSDARHSSMPRRTMLGRHVVTRAREVKDRRTMQKLLNSEANKEIVSVHKSAHQKRQKDKGARSIDVPRHTDRRRASKAATRKNMQNTEKSGRPKMVHPVLDYGDDAAQDVQAASRAVQTDRGLVDSGRSPLREQASTVLSRPRWMNTTHPAINGRDGYMHRSLDEEVTFPDVYGDSNMQSSVAHTSSSEESRLDWDTDEVRRLFGEIV